MGVLTHDPCCSSHGASLDCDTYRRTHFVEVGYCCDTWAERHVAGWVPRGCPAGFSSECPSWSSTNPCRCLEATLPAASTDRPLTVYADPLDL